MRTDRRTTRGGPGFTLSLPHATISATKASGWPSLRSDPPGGHTDGYGTVPPRAIPGGLTAVARPMASFQAHNGRVAAFASLQQALKQDRAVRELHHCLTRAKAAALGGASDAGRDATPRHLPAAQGTRCPVQARRPPRLATRPAVTARTTVLQDHRRRPPARPLGQVLSPRGASIACAVSAEHSLEQRHIGLAASGVVSARLVDSYKSRLRSRQRPCVHRDDRGAHRAPLFPHPRWISRWRRRPRHRVRVRGCPECRSCAGVLLRWGLLVVFSPGSFPVQPGVQTAERFPAVTSDG